ncbi:MAG: pyridoxamine 5'-phosphate oxidase family protein [Schwartzia sp.]|nr:pyridoxamine 5'-phosphate oxidase family protein [Schwartzia sp. (in: firmicutes)]
MMFREMRRKKQLLPPEECAQLLRKEKRGALAVIGDMGYPYAIPLNFYYDEDEATIYFHCAREGHKLDALRACDKTCFTVWEKGVQEPGDWAFYVRSVVIMGRAELVPLTDETRVMEKLRKLGAKYFPTVKDTEAEITKAANRVQLVALHIEHLTGKRVHEK